MGCPFCKTPWMGSEGICPKRMQAQQLPDGWVSPLLHGTPWRKSGDGGNFFSFFQKIGEKGLDINGEILYNKKAVDSIDSRCIA